MPILTIVCSRRLVPNVIGTLLLMGILGCDSNPWAVSPSDIRLKQAWEPLNLVELVKSLPTDSIAAVELFLKETGAFGSHYAEDILRVGPAEAPSSLAQIRGFATHPEVLPIFAAMDSISGSPECKAYHEGKILDAFKRFHSHFPEKTIPQLIWMNSGFNHAVYPTNEHLAIGLEWFLGDNHPIIQSLPPHQFPKYQRERMSPEYISASAMRGWILVHFSNPWYAPETCADELLFWGKTLFILEQLMPDTEPHLLMDWRAESWQWATENERQVWLELQPQSELFETNRMEFGRWFNEGPFTRAASIPQESPDRLGAWLGWQMVHDFMDDHPEMPLSELIALTDPVPVLKSYRPER